MADGPPAGGGGAARTTRARQSLRREFYDLTKMSFDKRDELGAPPSPSSPPSPPPPPQPALLAHFCAFLPSSDDRVKGTKALP